MVLYVKTQRILYNGNISGIFISISKRVYEGFINLGLLVSGFHALGFRFSNGRKQLFVLSRWLFILYDNTKFIRDIICSCTYNFVENYLGLTIRSCLCLSIPCTYQFQGCVLILCDTLTSNFMNYSFVVYMYVIVVIIDFSIINWKYARTI